MILRGKDINNKRAVSKAPSHAELVSAALRALNFAKKETLKQVQGDDAKLSFETALSNFLKELIHY
jgi:hypothetical protein